jgi:hypothetical protein
VIPSAERIADVSATILTALGLNQSQSPSPTQDDTRISKEQLESAFTALNRAVWSERVTVTGTGSELQAALDANGYVTLRNLSTWWLLEECFDGICAFLVQAFQGFTLRERQNTKIRVELSAVDLQGQRRRLAAMFGAIESQKAQLNIQEYSIAQTSLEQIFNFFAAQVSMCLRL